MSTFISSLIASIEGNGGQPQSPTDVTRPVAKSGVAGGSTAARTSGSNGIPAKRKAEEDANKSMQAKTQRVGGEAGITRKPISSGPPTPTAVAKPSVSQSGNQMPYRGTVGGPSSTPKPAVKASSNGVVASSTSKATTNNATQSVSAPAPKKGYLAILARANQSSTKQVPVGTIVHKPVEKVSKKERLGLQAEAAKAGFPVGKDKKAPLNNRPSTSSGATFKSIAPIKEKKKPVELEYKGTMRKTPTESAYKGTINRAPVSKSGIGQSRIQATGSGRGLPASKKPRMAGYASYSEEDLDDEEDDYASDGSSAMEAGAFDLDEEEQFSLAVARKEDEEALKEETAHQREKAARKKRLAEMAAAAAKKKRY
ncbi:hypothetical protein M501DRAFT_987415 [Patellaria atrata CBS 101060]|uniref:Chromatin SPT2 n=1 Tax=Patellaria atrata CBS 101060 TaxID=1346257 RepID=A0A9P4S5W6_9PEZI|nr:hypothetical protein M501DRAFT_987415 [Patellaria atrata CBS 101060]